MTVVWGVGNCLSPCIKVCFLIWNSLTLIPPPIGIRKIGMKLSQREKISSKTAPLHISILLLSFMFLSCGYTLQGGGQLPGKSKSVFVSIFKNRSSHTGAETEISNVLIEELMRSSSAKISDEPDSADAVIQGEISAISFSALSRTADDSVYERTVTVVVNMNMQSRSGRVLFSVKGLAESDEYGVSKINEADESAKSEAVIKVFHRLCQRIVSRMTYDF